MSAGSRRVPAAAVAIFIATLTLYTITLMPSIGFIDAGELVAATTTLGIVHPTGYPLFTILGYSITNFLPFGDDPAWRLNFLSALLGALAVSISFVLVHRVLVLLAFGPSPPGSKRGPSSPTTHALAQPDLRIAIAAASAALLAVSHTFWLWAVQAKAYTLHACFVAGLFLAALQTATPRPVSPAALRTVAFLLGLSFTNHLMTVMIVPALLVMVAPAVLRARRSGLLDSRELVTLAAVAALPLLLYLYLPIRARQQPLMNWGAPVDWPSFYRHVTGWQYRSFLLDTDLPFASKLAGALALWGRQFNLLLAIPLLGIALAGCVRLWIDARRLLVATLLVAGLQVGFAVTFGTTPEIHESYFVPF